MWINESIKRSRQMKDYLDEERFLKNSIKIIYQKINLKKYKQNHNQDFVSGLSILDVMMNCGFKKTEELIKNEQNLS